ncbi:MAG TPA: extracellular solute-binding protein [Ruminiclostridium sp.]
MRKSIKKIVSILLVVVMFTAVISMFGCGKNDPAKVEKVTLRYATHYSTTDPMFAVRNAVIEKFKKDNPNVTIEDENMAATQYHDKLKTEIASDTLPDIFTNWGGSEVYEAVKAKKLMELTEVLDKDTAFKGIFLDGQFKSANLAFKDIEGLYGMPFNNITAGFYYNKDLFDKAGVQIPKTWDELINVVKKLKDTGTIPWAIGGKDGWRVQHLQTALAYKMYGTKLGQDLAERKVKYVDTTVDSFKRIETLRDLGAFGPNPASVDFSLEQNMFMTGKAAMNFSLNVYTSLFESDTSEIKGKVGFFPMPYFSEKPEFKDSVYGGGSVVYSLNSKLTGATKEAAIKLLKAFCGMDGQKEFLKANAIIPVVKITDKIDVQPLQQQFVDQLANAKEFAGDLTERDTLPTMLNKLRNVSVGLLNKQLTAEQAAQEMDKEIELNK